MARIVERGLRRSVGVPGLFATAYGNVGSSIYYALGLVALHALGLTPVVFMVAGLLFALTAKTYAEGASMFPEAGGSSSFARHAFNELASFFAGWALTLDYVITIAISAFFVPHYLGAFYAPLRHNPGRLGTGLRRRDALPARPRRPHPPQAGACPGAPGDPPHGRERRLPPRARALIDRAGGRAPDPCNGAPAARSPVVTAARARAAAGTTRKAAHLRMTRRSSG